MFRRGKKSQRHRSDSEQEVTLIQQPFIQISFWILIYYTNNLTNHETEKRNEVIINTSSPYTAQLTVYIISLALSFPLLFWKDTTKRKIKVKKPPCFMVKPQEEIPRERHEKFCRYLTYINSR